MSAKFPTLPRCAALRTNVFLESSHFFKFIFKIAIETVVSIAIVFLLQKPLSDAMAAKPYLQLVQLDQLHIDLTKNSSGGRLLLRVKPS
jgi:hypothetical protein